MEVQRAGSAKTRRCDLVAFVNGLPFVVIENKRPTKDVGEGVSQLIGYQGTDNIPHLFHFAQLVMAMNRAEARYGRGRNPGQVLAGVAAPRRTGRAGRLPLPAGQPSPRRRRSRGDLFGRPRRSPPAGPPRHGRPPPVRSRRHPSPPLLATDAPPEPAPSPGRTAPSTRSAGPTASSILSASSPSSTAASARSRAISSTSLSTARSTASATGTPTAADGAASSGTPRARASRSPWSCWAARSPLAARHREPAHRHRHRPHRPRRPDPGHLPRMRSGARPG